MTSGFSGVPKFRQSVTATGVAPVTATLRYASARASCAPCVRVELAVAAVGVGRDREAEAGLLVDADHAAVVGEAESAVLPST